jgi:Ca2+-binding RTX toxin-like protein
MLAGTDTLTYAGSLASVTVNLLTGTASGFSSIANIENVTGGTGNDTLTGDANTNVLNGGGGNDTLTGGLGDDTLTGGAGTDSFGFAAVFGDDTITDFDANPTGGQDLLDVTLLGITAGNFGTRVVITDLGANTLVTIDGTDTITLLGVSGTPPNVITQADFILASNPNTAPTGAPAISDPTPAEDQLLTASAGTLADADGLGALSFQWESSANGVTWSNIVGATAATFTPGDAQVGQLLRVTASYTDGQGTAESVSSAATAAVLNVNDTPTGAPAIDDTTPTIGQVLTASAGTLADADGLGALSFQWESSANGVTWSNITGATAATFTPGAAQLGLQLRVVASYTDLGGDGAGGQVGTAESVSSAATAAVANVNNVPTGAPAISDTTPAEDQVLTALAGTLADADGLGALSFQWQSSSDGLTWSNIAGATAAAFAPGDAQVGQQLRVMASYTDGQGAAEAVASAATAAVLNVNDAPTGAPAIDDTTPAENQLLTASTLGIADADGLGAFSFQWQSSSDGLTWSNIVGANTANFTPGAAQVGQQLRVVASYTDLGGDGPSGQVGTVESVSAAATAAVTAAAPAPGVTIIGTTGADTINGTAGSDNLQGRAGDDVINGLAGNDTLLGEGGADTLNGGDNDDTLDGGAGSDTLNGGNGNDNLLGGNNPDILNGDAGNDTLSGGDNTDTLNGGDGDDIMHGDASADTLNGGIGNDTLFGDGGNDTLIGGAGNDILHTSGGGNDIFVFDAVGFGDDTVQAGFDATGGVGAQDLLDISALGITAATFAASVAITDLGNDTLVEIGADSILLLGVNGVNTNAITQADFILA